MKVHLIKICASSSTVALTWGSRFIQDSFKTHPPRERGALCRLESRGLPIHIVFFFFLENRKKKSLDFINNHHDFELWQTCVGKEILTCTRVDETKTQKKTQKDPKRPGEAPCLRGTVFVTSHCSMTEKEY